MSTHTTHPDLLKLDELVESIIVLVFTCTLLLACCSCSSTKAVVQQVQKDTLYLSTLQYDSVFIQQDKWIDRSADTIRVKDSSIEYRYKFLRDTVYKVRTDSIPYPVTVVRTKEVPRSLNVFDYLYRISFGLLIVIILMTFRTNVKL